MMMILGLFIDISDIFIDIFALGDKLKAVSEMLTTYNLQLILFNDLNSSAVS